MADVRSWTPADRPVSPDAPGAGLRWVLAALSLGAALLHASAIGMHEGLAAVLFAIAAAVQAGWALAILAAPGRAMLAAGAAINGALLAVYVVSRITALPVDGLDHVEPVGLKDLTTAVFEGLIIVGALLALRPATDPNRRTLRLPAAASGALAVALMAFAVPALAAGHDTGDDHAHGDSTATHNDTTTHNDTAAASDHADDHGDDHAAGADSASTDLHGVEMTDAQHAAAQELIAATEESLARWADPAAAVAAGYKSIGDALTGFEHYVHAEYSASEDILDPERPESLVYLVGADGSRTLGSAMYILPNGPTEADIPDTVGPASIWHDHQNLCWNPNNPGVLAGILINGRCVPGGVLQGTAPMLHVWVVDHPCGPFSELEESGSIIPGGGPRSRLLAQPGAATEPNCGAGHGDHDDGAATAAAS